MDFQQGVTCVSWCVFDFDFVEGTQTPFLFFFFFPRVLKHEPGSPHPLGSYGTQEWGWTLFSQKPGQWRSCSVSLPLYMCARCSSSDGRGSHGWLSFDSQPEPTGSVIIILSRRREEKRGPSPLCACCFFNGSLFFQVRNHAACTNDAALSPDCCIREREPFLFFFFLR